MSSCSLDECLLTVAATKKEGPAFVKGVLMINATQLAWSPDDPSAAKPLLLQRSSITKTQRAPDKPFLKLDTAGGANILGFATLDERNTAVDVLVAVAQSKAPTSKVATGPHAALKRELLKQNRDLRTLYGQLVNSGTLSEAEFWQSRQHLLKAAAAQAGGKDGGSAAASGAGSSASGAGSRTAAAAAAALSAALLPKQRAGLSSAMLASVRPSADGQTDKVQFTVQPEAIKQILAEKPEVRNAYQALVPTSLSHKDFWHKYFQREYKAVLRRQQLAKGIKKKDGDDEDDEEDIIAPFRKQWLAQEAQRAQSEISRVDPTVNLAADVHDRLGGGFGLRLIPEEPGGPGGAGGMAAGGQQPRPGTAAAAAAAQQQRGGLAGLAYDINRHAAFVLEGAPEWLEEEGRQDKAGPEGSAGDEEAAQALRLAQALQAQQKKKEKAAAAASAAAGEDGTASSSHIPEERLQEWQQRAASALEDLKLDDESSRHVPLSIQDPRLYFDRGSTAEDTASADLWAQGGAAAAGPDPLQALAAVDLSNLTNPPCSPGLAAKVVFELAQEEDAGLVAEFGPVAATALGQPPQKVLLADLLALLRDEALKTNELLRLFWACVPIVSAPRKDKADRFCRALEQQRTMLQAHMAARPGTVEQVYITQMLRPLAAAVDAALEAHRSELVLLAKTQQAVAMRAAAAR